MQEIHSKLHMQARQTLIKALIINQRVLEYDVFQLYILKDFKNAPPA